MKTIKQILDNKGRDVFTIDPGAAVIDAVKDMASRKIGALIVLQEARVVGVFTEQILRAEYCSKNAIRKPRRWVM